MLREHDERRRVRVVADSVRAPDLIWTDGAVGRDAGFRGSLLVKVVHLSKDGEGEGGRWRE
jgi:hypothetical protein